MASRNFAMGMVYLTQTVLGIVGNFSLLYQYAFPYFTKCRSRPTALILKQLFVTNSLVILCKGIPQTIAAFGMRDFLSDLGCKLVFYIHRVGRGMSLSTTCLLSVFQVITIHPRDSRWAELKVKAPKYMGIFNALCWVLHILVNTVVLRHVTAKWSNKNITYKQEFGYCSAVDREKTRKIPLVILILFPDVACVGLMLWASSSMIVILYRHKQQVRHIYSTKAFPTSSPETRATKTILLLVCTFVSFYTLSSIFHVIFVFYKNPNWVMVSMAALVTGCFPTISPYLLMSPDTSASSFCFPWKRDTKPTNFMRYV